MTAAGWLTEKCYYSAFVTDVYHYEGVYGVCPPSRVVNLDERVYECVKAAYAGEVTLVDKWVGHLLDALEAMGVMDDTLIVFTSDTVAIGWRGCSTSHAARRRAGTDGSGSRR